MTEETAKKVSELYKKKSEISGLISKILDEDMVFSGLAYYNKIGWSAFNVQSLKVDFISELKEFCLDKIRKELDEVENEIANISCK